MSALTIEQGKQKKPLLVIVTGLSGAGKSTVINALEDIGFYCIDNLPSELWQPTLSYIKSVAEDKKHFAIGIDGRDSSFINLLPKGKKLLLEQGELDLDVIFLTADDDVLVTRFNTTRRRHPLLDISGELLSSIRRERELLRGYEEVADIGLDTTWWSPHQLARSIEQRYATRSLMRHLHVTITSFGFKYGLLRNADLVYDVRFLPNPHFVPELKLFSGLNKDVARYIFSHEMTNDYFMRLVDFNAHMLPLHYQEGKHYLRIGIGCTGGKHRSVCLAENLAESLAAKSLENMLYSVHHRDLDFDAKT